MLTNEIKIAFEAFGKDGNIIRQETGECHGHIALSQAGENGFGYDPIFIPDGYDITIAQMSEEEKNSISHRSRALRKMIDYINYIFFFRNNYFSFL